jgi:saccharopine dehydrogenase (NAD+, L-lysine-forming)
METAAGLFIETLAAGLFMETEAGRDMVRRAIWEGLKVAREPGPAKGSILRTFLEVENAAAMTAPTPKSLMNFFFHELLMRENRTEAGRILTNAKPPVDADVVYVHVAAEGWVDGALRRREFVRAYYPLDIAGKSRTAIAWTTSASVVAVIEMVRAGALPRQGFLKQESIPLDAFLATQTGNYYQIGHRGRHG